MYIMVSKIRKLVVSILLVGLVGCNMPKKNPPLISKLRIALTPQVSNPIVKPNNVFGITLYTLDEAGGLTKAAQAGTGWTRNGFIWNTIEPMPGERNWNINAELEQGLIMPTPSVWCRSCCSKAHQIGH
jgi:hypothetical protein